MEYSKKGKTFSVKANAEVILSAGAINSPQILMNSGIGDSSELNKHGIDVLHELKGVGKNLQDHYAVVNSFNCTQPITLHRSASFIKTQMSGLQYYFSGQETLLFLPPVREHFLNQVLKKIFQTLKYITLLYNPPIYMEEMVWI